MLTVTVILGGYRNGPTLSARRCHYLNRFAGGTWCACCGLSTTTLPLLRYMQRTMQRYLRSLKQTCGINGGPVTPRTLARHHRTADPTQCTEAPRTCAITGYG